MCVCVPAGVLEGSKLFGCWVWLFGFTVEGSEGQRLDLHVAPHASSLHIGSATLLSIIFNSGPGPGLADCLKVFFERGFSILTAPTVLEINGILRRAPCHQTLTVWVPPLAGFFCSL